MKIRSTATDGKILDDVIVTKAVGYHIAVLLVLTHLNLLLVKINVKAAIGLIKTYNIEVVYKHIRKNGGSADFSGW